MPDPKLSAWAHDLARDFKPFSATGIVARVSGLSIEVEDRLGQLDIGARIEIETTTEFLDAEIVGVSDGTATALPFGSLDGVRRGAQVKFLGTRASVRPSEKWLGRVVDALGRPIDGKGPMATGARAMPLRALPPPAPLRARLGAPVDFGIKALNGFSPARAGQRLGIFSGSGIGKSALLSMIAQNIECDVSVIALIGERGREVREFIEDNLGPDGLARAVIVVATSDEPAMMRREAAYLAMTIAEYFREQDAHVLCLMDSMTRVAAAQREIGLAAGEPPTAKGYTPSVFSLLPKLLERAGPGLQSARPQTERAGAITGIFTVLVEGDDHDEPVADAARSILDGHVVLDRRISESGRYPAIDILKTISRTATSTLSEENAAIISNARKLASVYSDMRELIRIGAYQSGANDEIDMAIEFHEHLETFLNQSRHERYSIDESFRELSDSLAMIGTGSEEGS